LSCQKIRKAFHEDHSGCHPGVLAVAAVIVFFPDIKKIFTSKGSDSTKNPDGCRKRNLQRQGKPTDRSEKKENIQKTGSDREKRQSGTEGRIKYHEVQRGESLAALSLKYYGTTELWSKNL